MRQKNRLYECRYSIILIYKGQKSKQNKIQQLYTCIEKTLETPSTMALMMIASGQVEIRMLFRFFFSLQCYGLLFTVFFIV